MEEPNDSNNTQKYDAFPTKPDELHTVREETINLYDALLKLEQRQPQETDLITAAKVLPDSEEYSKLKAAGVTDEEIEKRKIPRAKLKAAGFAFVNRIYLPYKGEEMQKPLINEIINGEDYGKKTLLTTEEMAQLRIAQENPLITPDIREEMRMDMLSFMLDGKNGRPRNFEKLSNIFHLVTYEMDDAERETFENFFGAFMQAQIEIEVNIESSAQNFDFIFL